MTFINRRNVVVALLMGPALVFGSLALQIPDQGFDSVAGPSGFVLLALISAGISLVLFLLSALLGNGTFSLCEKWLRETLATWCARILVSALLATAYYLTFRLPTVKLQLFATVLIAFSVALFFLRMEPARGRAKTAQRAT